MFTVKYRMGNEYFARKFDTIELARKHVKLIEGLGWPARIQTKTGRVY